MLCFFFFNDTATTEIYTYLHTLALHDALPIFPALPRPADGRADGAAQARRRARGVEQRDARLSGAAARRLRLCALARPLHGAAAGDHPSCAFSRRRALAPDRHRAARTARPGAGGAEIGRAHV